MDAELIAWTVAHDVRRLPRRGFAYHLRAFLRNAAPTLLLNGAFALGCAWLGKPWLYAAWVLAYLTTFTLFIRIRSLAEHACTSFTSDPFANTRTTRAGFVARSTVAPIRVNYHLEHHFLMSVPFFRLPAMHRLLRERGAVAEPPSYLKVLALVSSR
jgi:fatty acid desaturase